MVKDVNKYGMIVMTITKGDIESFNHEDQLKFLFHVKENARSYEGKINIMLIGYDDDERELWEIQEVRNYFDFLDRCFPYWFFFLNRRLPKEVNPIGLVTVLVVPIKSIISSNEKRKILQMDLDALEQFINVHFDFLNELTDELGMSEDKNREISNEIIALLMP